MARAAHGQRALRDHRRRAHLLLNVSGAAIIVQTTESVASPRRLRIIGCAIGLWSLLYLLPHLYWAIGGARGLSALRPSIETSAHWRTINWIASAILAAAALVGFAFTRPSGPVLRAFLWGAAWIGCSVATSHGIIGVILRAAALAAWSDGTSALPRAWLHSIEWLIWDLLVFEPWFLIEGILLGIAGWSFARDRRQRRYWIAACAIGVGLGIATALLRVRFA